MVIRLFHPLLRDATKDIREAGRNIPPMNILKVSGLGDNITVSDLAQPYQPNTCMISMFNG